MTTHIAVLPTDVLDTISMKLNERVVGNGINGCPTNAQFLRLPHPRTGIPSLFLPYRLSKTDNTIRWGLLEVQSVTPPNPRSWLFSSDEVVEDGKLLVMTPIDPTFVLIPILQVARPPGGTLGKFCPLHDIFDEVALKLAQQSVGSSCIDSSSVISSRDILSLASLDCISDAMRRLCDVKDITADITVYRYSEEKLVEYLRGKVSRLSKQQVSEKSRTVTRRLAKDGLMDDGKERLLERKLSNMTTRTLPEYVVVGRIKAACDLVSQYLPPDTYKSLKASYDFSPLDEHLKALENEMTAMTVVNAPASKAKKVNGDEQDGKKRKMKPKGSQGTEKLKKANLNGMSKISSFFQKK
ncbi:hypothetical protein HETIRDRAFT_418828 [Heterobasidion irregulare TC 32-1]|uniref:Ribonuclease H2 subunit B n=1 Tax=Heterobasidion irregulare (strain TC 32-1) TaxID=747525 RepID=W4K4Y8_HETIT|nr:uncharacterized protein HETIRDRAFT_418828 [Heterobasidion irregulare TC 32-1]ETW80883.1 hypothetical protein HETIRDRAFT_418828 [Heterobasidion irregulare TC 32-1]